MNDFNTNSIIDNSKEELKDVKRKGNLVGFMSITATFAFFATSAGISYLFKLLAKNVSAGSDAVNILNSFYSGLINLVGIGVVGMFFILIKKDTTSNQLPFKRVKGSTLFPLIAIGFSVCMVSNLLTSLFMLITQSMGLDFSYSSAETSVITTPAEIMVHFISIAVVPAVSEEILFRGAILSTLRKYGDGIAVFTSALLFGLFHGNLLQIPFAFIVGLVLGWTVVYTNSMLPAILIHFVNNAYSVFVSILSTNEELWELNPIITTLGSTLFIVGVSILAFFSAMKLSRKDHKFLSLKKYDGTLSSSQISKTVFKSPLIIMAIILLCIETTINHIF